MFTYTFLECFSCFSLKKFVFLSFSFLFFWWSIKFPQQIINQSETRIGDKKLSVSKHCKHSYLIACFHDQLSHFYSIGHYVSELIKRICEKCDISNETYGQLRNYLSQSKKLDQIVFQKGLSASPLLEKREFRQFR